jgi:hypothetical protein
MYLKFKNGENNFRIIYTLEGFIWHLKNLKIKLKELINDEDKILLEEFEKNYHEKNIYFKLTKESIPFITRLSTREILFSTIYFTKYPCTIWGNYNKSFPIFYHDNNDIQQYLNIKNELQFF